MSDQLLKDTTALRMFFTEPVYLTGDSTATPIVIAPQAEETTATDEPEVVPALPVYEFIGKNKRHILIIVNDKANKVGTPAGTELLRNIVKHLQFDKDDFALLNYANYPDASFASLKTFFQCNSVIAFGVIPTQMGLPEDFGLNNTLSGTRVVFGANLNEMAENVNAKKVFWGVLKNVDQW